MANFPSIPEALAQIGATFLERGWLSANNVLFIGKESCALVDSGYFSHAPQTVSLIQQQLGGRSLDWLLNTHLHSDHCGGNAALQATYPHLKTLIPPGLAHAVANWDPVELTYSPTGQVCPPFTHQGMLTPGHCIELGPMVWEIHAAKGHDPHSIVLFQPEARVLLSADALWEHGFGVVFPELEGIAAFDEVAETLDLIQQLKPSTVVPGHGPPFQDLESAMARARARLDHFVNNPDKHLRHAVKVLIKFRILEWQRVLFQDLLQWARETPYLKNSMAMENAPSDTDWLDQLLNELIHSGAIAREGNWIANR